MKVAEDLYNFVTSYDKYTCKNYLSLVIDQSYQTGGIRSEKWKDIYIILKNQCIVMKIVIH